MKKRRRLRKGLAMLLSLAMVAGLVPAMSGGANKVQAATGSGTEPSVSAYATKTQLMDGTFAPNAEGTAVNYGKLVFGKNSSGASQEWYILGKDELVSGDNTIIFAASPIAINQVFEDDWENKKAFQSSFGVYVSNPSEVYPNHYGASDLREVLKSMATNMSYFTTAEQDLMNATTVTTKETKNSNVTYTTTDKLYALQGDLDNYYKLWAGTSDSTVLAKSSYWSNGSYFWLRSPAAYDERNVLLATPVNCVVGNIVYDDFAVQPASNLNLSSVLFASSAKAASSDTAESGIIKDGTAMTLRLNGTGKNIGTVTYNATTGDIKATKGSTSQTVALIVQGNDGKNDWYYSKKIDASETVNASAIRSALGLASDIDLSTCKIWLEITDTDGLIYEAGAYTTYVTKEQLMNSFKPNSDGTAVNYGKLVFGKNSSGASQEWYILGKDEGISGDNTIIFAASPIATEQVFEDDQENNKTDTSLWSDCDYNGASITEVHPNHYGASDLRVALQDMAKNTSYFTTAEQGLMNATTVTTKDTKNSNVTYTTTDKLYALADDYGNSTIKAGTSDSTVLAMSSYWSNGSYFWLRSPAAYYDDGALFAVPGTCVGRLSVYRACAVQPASNLNLSSVLFASSATAASSDTVSGTLTDGKAMTLRLNGTGKNIGTVTYNATTGDIKATKGSTSQTVALVVQGKDGTNNWYYSKKIDAAETVNASAIKSALSLLSDIDLSDCKIWLETTDSTENLIYAVGATEVLNITSVEITGRILTENGASIVGEMTGPANYKLGQDVTLTVPVIAGYNFVGWYVYSEDSPNYTGENLCTSRTYTFTAEADRNLVAVYKLIGSAELKISGGKDFTINGDSKTTAVTVPYPLGSQITVVCNDNDFEYWENSAGMVVSRDKSYTFTVTGKETISAVINTIAADKATVVFESYYGQVIARDQYAAGATLVATPGLPFRYGYTALGWDYNGDGIYDTSEGTEDTFEKALERGFASDDKLVKILPVYQLNETTYQITVENGTGAGTYNQNEVVTVVANAAADGYKFSHWADNAGNILSYNEEYQFYAAKSITVTAVYVAVTEKVEAKGTTEIVDKYADKANGKLTFVSMSTVPEGCTIDKAGIIATNDQDVAESGDGFNASTAKIVRGNAWSGDAYRYTWSIKMSAGQTCYVRAYLVYTDAEGNVNTVYGKKESLTMPE